MATAKKAAKAKRPRKTMSASPKPITPDEQKAKEVPQRPVVAGDSTGELFLHKDHKTHVLVFDVGGGQRAMMPVTIVSDELIAREYNAITEADTDGDGIPDEEQE